jgi:hypothetical protein
LVFSQVTFEDDVPLLTSCSFYTKLLIDILFENKCFGKFFGNNDIGKSNKGGYTTVTHLS